MSTTRLSSDLYLWNLAFAASRRGTCDRFKGGCVVAREGIPIVTGYNGSAPGEPQCDEVGHDIVETRRLTSSIGQTFDHPQQKFYSKTEEHCVRTIHSEINAIINAAYLGVSLLCCEWYMTGTPCARCKNAIARLRPICLFCVVDQGGVDDDKVALLKWWHDRNVSLTIHTVEDLKLAGVEV